MSILSLNHLVFERARNEPGSSTPPVHQVRSGADADADTFILGVPDKSLKMQQCTFGQLNLSASLLAAHYATVLPTRARGDAATKLTVALLAPSNYECACKASLSRWFY